MSGRARSFLTVGLEALLLSMGVFLGLLGDQWREDRQDQHLAEESLQRFASEISENQRRVERAAAYHDSLVVILGRRPAEGDPAPEGFHGMSDASLEHGAWDLALATQSLDDIDARLSFLLSRMYTAQADYVSNTDAVRQALYTTFAGGFAGIYPVLDSWLADTRDRESRLLAFYAAALERIEGDSGESPQPSSP